MWLLDAGTVFNLEDFDTGLVVRAFVAATPYDALPEPTDRKAVEKALGRFRKDVIGEFTVSQLSAAMSFALWGDDPSAGELPPPKDGGGEREGGAVPFEVGVLRDGVALRLGAPSELSRLRASKLLSLIECAQMAKYGKDALKSAHSRALGE